MWPLVVALLGCEPPPPLDETACADAAARTGVSVCAHRVPDLAVWAELTTDGEAADQIRSTKYLFPASEADPLPPLIVDSGTYALHIEMLTQAFPDQFPGWTQQDYSVAVLDPDRRVFWSGNLNEYVDPTGGTFYGFTVWDDPADASTTVTYDQVLGVWEELQSRFDLGRVLFVPNSNNQRAAVEDWPASAPFDVRGDDGVRYEPYTTGVGYGTVRRVRIVDLAAAQAAASFGYQDILVLDDAPFDVERPVSGVVTGGRQAELSHLNVRSAARGTPNCFVADAWERLAAWEGQLVRLECGEVRWRADPAELSDAEAWWDALRPDAVAVDPPDLSVTELPGLLDLPTDTVEARHLGLVRYGAKGRNLATLYQRIAPQWQLSGFLVPFAAYDGFVHSTSWTVDLGDGPRAHTFAETLDAWHADDAFLTDAAVRTQRLTTLVDAMEDAPVDDAWRSAVAARIEATWGTDTQMVRFRSSSNAEDSLTFTGAGLYESESVCLADDRDADDTGPSRCDPDQPKERGLRRGLAHVWASLWGPRAWEERDWYGIDHRDVAMAVLVDDRLADEQANIVAFTGNPTADDDRFLVNAQLGELEVVAADPGVWPERTLLDVRDGQVVDILRVGTSSERPDGEVLSDAQLTDLGAELWLIREVFPVDDPVPPGFDLLLDTEWKIADDGRMIIKQVRPFLRRQP